MTDSSCPVTRGDIDLSWFADRDSVWRELNLAAPARRALVNAGLFELADLASWASADVAALHGIGKNALAILKPYLRH